MTPNPEFESSEREDLDAIAADLTDEIGIRLEYEAAYDWVAFVPQRESDAGALTKYFGKRAHEESYKTRGIEARQRSTPPFVERFQRDCICVLDETRDPESVVDRLETAIGLLEAGRVDPADLVERNRISKPVDAYTQYTQNVAALERARDQGLDVHPGQDIEYVVVDDEKGSRERVALAHEAVDDYDESYYETQLVRAIESVLSPLGWDRTEIRQRLTDTTDATLAAYSECVIASDQQDLDRYRKEPHEPRVTETYSQNGCFHRRTG